MECPRCQSNQYCKDGYKQGRQRYQCKGCKYRYIIERRDWEKSSEIKEMAINMYLEGLGFRAIGRLLKISYVTVFYWVKAYDNQQQLEISKDPTEVMELDELHTYIQQKKKYCWIWIAVDRKRKRYISYVCGDRSTQTGIKLWEKVKDITITDYYATDYWKSYGEFLPTDKHIQSKAETYTVEGYNSRIRHYLARFRRKTKCYSKSLHMIIASLNLLFLKLNNNLSI